MTHTYNMSCFEGPLGRLLLLCSKHFHQKQLGKERIYFSLQLSNHTPSLKEVKAGIWRKETTQRPWMGATYWFDPHGFLSLFYYGT